MSACRGAGRGGDDARRAHRGQAPGEDHRDHGERERQRAGIDLLAEQRDLLAMLLVWEIGKPWKLACADVDRALDGVRWYLGEIGRQLGGRNPLPGPVSNIASWNYPMSVLVHAELVQLLAGNAVISKTPSQGGFHTLTLAHAIVGLSEGASRRLIERGGEFDPDEVAGQLSAFAWAGLRGIHQPVPTS